MFVSNSHSTDQPKDVINPVVNLPHLRDVDYLSSKIKQLLQEFKQSLTILYGERLAKVVLYGSFARYEETEGSDVDVLVVLKGDVSHADEIWRMGDDKIALLLKYDELISVVPMSHNDFLHRDSPLLRNIRQDGILL